MKKKLIAMISILLLIAVSGIGIFFGIRNNSNMMLQELYLNKWNDAYARYLICRANVTGEPWVTYGECILSFYSDSEKSDIVKATRKIILGKLLIRMKVLCDRQVCFIQTIIIMFYTMMSKMNFIRYKIVI